MTSSYSECYVWIWLPNKAEPVVAGKLEVDASKLHFNYGKSYLERIDDNAHPAIAIFDEELPLKAGALPLRDGLSMPSSIRDAAPDAWGRRVIINKKLGKKNDANIDFDELTYLLESGSDRIGALDFQLSPSEYVPRSAKNASLKELLESAARVEKGVPLTDELDQALFRGSSIGGARPKALIENGDKKYIAKFSSSDDLYSVVKAEFIAMRMAALCGINAACVSLAQASGKDVLLIGRFDRENIGRVWHRKALLSALTLFGLDDMMARYASYETLAEIIRRRFSEPRETLRELYARLVFNILCGNTDDHARNHAALWDGVNLFLSPAYDICPQGRSGGEASQAMLISGQNRMSRIAGVIDAAPQFLLSKEKAFEIFEAQKQVIEQNWQALCEEARLSEVDQKYLWGRQFLNPYAFEGLKE